MGSVHVVRDITELKNLREKLVMSEKMAALGEVEFAASESELSAFLGRPS